MRKNLLISKVLQTIITDSNGATNTMIHMISPMISMMDSLIFVIENIVKKS